MTRDDLIREFRALAQDTVEPALFSNEQIGGWLTQAESEAAIRGRLLHESANPALCEISVSVGEAGYPLHPALYEVTHLSLRLDGETRREPVKLVSGEYLDESVPDWRDLTGRPRFAIQTETSMRLVPTPDRAGTLLLEGYRLPLKELGAVGVNKPEIHLAHHHYLVHWALHKAFSIPDAETFDPNRSVLAERAFTAYFGPRPDSDLRRTTRHDEPHHNKLW